MEKYSIVLSITPSIPNVQLLNANNQKIETNYDPAKGEYTGNCD
jgi:hypothetical protein